MYDTRTISAEEYIPMNVYCTILFRGLKFGRFRNTKTSVNKRLICLVMPIRGGNERNLSRPLIPSVKHHGGKSTE